MSSTDMSVAAATAQADQVPLDTADPQDLLATPPTCGIKTCLALGTSLPRHKARGGSAPSPLGRCVTSAVVRVDSRCESEEEPLQHGEWSEESEVGRTCDHEPTDNGPGESALESRPGSAGYMYADSIRDRVLRMLIGNGERPRRSDLEGIPGSCTNRLVVAARRVVRELFGRLTKTTSDARAAHTSSHRPD